MGLGQEQAWLILPASPDAPASGSDHRADQRGELPAAGGRRSSTAGSAWRLSRAPGTPGTCQCPRPAAHPAAEWGSQHAPTVACARL